MLHGSPATIVLGNGGIKMAGGRPGKEMGDGEQKFLKGWVEKEKSRGLVDMVAFRFGDYMEELEDANAATSRKRGESQGGYWFWGNSAKSSIAAAMSTNAPRKRNSKGPASIMPQDGCIFPGTGALETHSVGDISTYISELYQHGDEAGARSSGGRRLKEHRKRPKEPPRPITSPSAGGNSSADSSAISNSTTRPTTEEPEATTTPPPPPPAGPNPKQAVKADVVEGSSDTRGRVAEVVAGESSKSRSSSNTNAKILNLLTFGWSGGSTKSGQTKNNQIESTVTTSLPEPEAVPPPMMNVEPMSEPVDGPEDSKVVQVELNDSGKNKRARFAIGFLGDLYADDLDDDLEDEHSSGRITSRAVWVERRKRTEDDSSSNDPVAVDSSRHRKRRNSEAPTIKQSSMDLEEFRIVVYTVSTFTFPPK